MLNNLFIYFIYKPVPPKSTFTQLVPPKSPAKGDSGDPELQNAVCCRDVSGSFVDDTAAFGPKAHRPPKSILNLARVLPGTAFARH